MLDVSDRLAIALQTLAKRHALDVEALAAVLDESHPTWAVERAVRRGLGVVCSTEHCAAWALVPDDRKAEARALLLAEDMGDLLTT